MGTLICTIEMDKNDGLTVTIKGDSITQTVKMNGTTIELKVVGDDGTSVITQSATKVSIACKQFEVKAEETVSISSGKASTYKSSTTLAVESAQAMTLKSDAEIEGKGQKGMALEGAEGKLDLTLSGGKLSGPTVELAGQATLKGKAPQVKMNSDAMMSLESSGLCTLKGSLTNVQGSLVNLG